jgi:hypothetical protein
VSKFVAKFRKNDYDEDYGFDSKRKKKNGLGEMRKMKKRRLDDYDTDQFQRSGTNKFRKSY